MTGEPLRIGVLGAARIATDAIIGPAQELGARLVSVAARDRARAADFAEQHGFESVADDYQAVIDDPEVEVVYNPLVNNLHAEWNLRAVAAGKPVLTEKPSAGNAAAARRVRDAARAAGVPVIEAFHQVYHPLMERMLELAAGAEIGELQYVEARMLMPPPAPSDPRWSAELAGGGLMDVGCYAVQAVRDVAAAVGGIPEVLAARAGETEPYSGVDGWLSADFALPNGVAAHLESGMTHHRVDFSLRLVGRRGEAFAPNFAKPQVDDRILFTVGAEPREEHCGTRASYTYMLEAFTRLVRDGVPMRTDAAQAVEAMALIDELYLGAGLAPRIDGLDAPTVAAPRL